MQKSFNVKTDKELDKLPTAPIFTAKVESAKAVLSKLTLSERDLKDLGRKPLKAN